jgi:hypothetical protein
LVLLLEDSGSQFALEIATAMRQREKDVLHNPLVLAAVFLDVLNIDLRTEG